jgi:hypothetical protein
MSIADIDRPAVVFHYDRWNQDVVFRPISAKTFALLATDFTTVDGQDVDTPAALGFYAALLAACVESHVATAEEWLEISGPSLQVLGKQALRVNGLLTEEAKKN